MIQKTIASPISIEGIGAHSGKRSRIDILPASEDSGILFMRTDIDGDNSIAADFANVSETTLCTRLSNKSGVSVSMVEHVLATLYGFQISNAIIKVDGEEIPVLDGSSAVFAREIASVGIIAQSKKRKCLKILKTVKISYEEKWSSLSPADHLVLNLSCDFSKKGLKTTPFSYDLSQDNFATEIAPARTFGFFDDVEYLHKNNLALGASMENTVVFDANGNAMNEEGLRFDNEPIRHKMLDIIGDLSLSGYMIIGQYDGFCSGHKLNNMLLHALFSASSTDAFCFVTDC
ncbi:UDP-3-O-acyl-N-acetylglucosamine deacetylase [Alphaproteobacteria bacterium]|nr:UDP-3-O-acyl-N-acetylglucosamine deacetylase [Alphaproteobacteria bacterium]